MIESQKLMFRPITADDTDMVVSWRNSRHVKQNFIYRTDVTYEDHISWLESKVDTGKVIQFIVLEKESAKPIGSVYFRDIDMVSRKAEYGVFIGETDYIGKGYGSEIAQTMVDYSFNEMHLHKLSLRVLETNKPAIRSYEKAGFKVEGVMRDEEFIEGKYETVIFMAVLEDDR